MKSVLFINYEYPPTGAGAANATRHLADGIASRAIRTSVLTSAYRHYRGPAEEETVTVYRIGAWRRHAEKSSPLQMIIFAVSALFHLAKVIHRESPDVIVVFFSIPCGPLGLYARIRWGIPYAVMLRGGDVPGSDSRLLWYHRILTPLRRLVYRRSGAVIANSESLRIMAEHADPGTAVSVVANGVDTAFFSPATQSDTTPSRPFTFLFIGRVCPQKNLPLLLEAFSACRTHTAGLQLVIAGDGPDRPRLAVLAQRLSIMKFITWTGWETSGRLLIRYRQADCFVNPSFNEGMPNAVLEAMSCGLPVIASDCSGNRDIVQDGLNGTLFPPGSAHNLEKAMSALAADRASARQMGMNGRKICTERYSWDVATEAFF